MDRGVSSSGRAINPAPLEGGDPLHLSVHIEGELANLEPQLFEADGRAVLTVGRGWYGHLHRSTDLSDDRQVDVIDPGAGRLGIYQRSATTGRWFSGDESIHLVGTTKHD